ncbi:MAG: antitoxin VapB family protein [Candidatus Diapherotrites archaeon]|nr:antitoxin VapB family protein [Candidatus Diapherotrites archaeon]
MAKLIAVSEPAYQELKNLKKENESFSKVILRLTTQEKQKPLTYFSGLWKNEKEFIGQLEKMVTEDRKKTKLRSVEL